MVVDRDLNIPLWKNDSWVPIWIFGSQREIGGCCLCVLHHVWGKTVFYLYYTHPPTLPPTHTFSSLTELILFKRDYHYIK